MPNPILDAAIVGPGRWGQRLVDAVSVPASAKLRFTHAVARTPDKVRAYCGARGWLRLLDHRILEICDIDGKVRRIEYPHVDIERADLEAFADAVAGVEQYPVPVEEAVHGVAVMEAAIRSARSEGQRVAVEAAAV